MKCVLLISDTFRGDLIFTVTFFLMLCRPLSVVGALNVTHVFGLSRVIALMLYCKPAHWHHQVQSVVHTCVLMLHLTLFFMATGHLLS